MTFGDYPMDKLLFVLTAAWIGISIPTKHFWTGSAKTAANFAYGVPGCVDELAASVKIDMIDGHEPLDVGFNTQGFSSSEFFDAFRSEFANDDCALADAQDDACALEFSNLAGTVSHDHRWTTTFKPNVETTTTASSAYADDAKIDARIVKNVINTDINRVVSPYLEGDQDTKCKEILARVRHEGDKYNPFDDSKLSKVLFCSAVYGWPLGEHCDTVIDNPDLFYGEKETGTANELAGVAKIDDAIALLTDEEKNTMRNTCRNVTRATCATKKYDGAVFEVGAGYSTNPVTEGTTFALQPTAKEDNSQRSAAELKTSLIANPCMMITGFGQHPKYSLRDTEIGDDKIKFPGSRSHARAGKGYFNVRNGKQPAIYPTSEIPHFQTLDENTVLTSKEFSPDGDMMRYRATDGDVNGAVYPDVDVDANTEFARVHVPLGETDLQYISERMYHDVMVLAQGAQAVDREKDFWNKIDQRCFSDGVNGSTDVLIIFSATCIIFVFLGTFLRGFIGQQGCFNMDSNFAKSALNFNNYVLAIIGGVAGFLASWDLGGFAAQSGDFHTDRVPLLSAMSGELDGAAKFAAAIDEGQFHSFVELTPSEAALIHALTAFSLLIIVAGSFVTVIETRVGTKGGVGWVKLDGSGV
jgi:hypothetical protein